MKVKTLIRRLQEFDENLVVKMISKEGRRPVLTLDPTAVQEWDEITASGRTPRVVIAGQIPHTADGRPVTTKLFSGFFEARGKVEGSDGEVLQTWMMLVSASTPEAAGDMFRFELLRARDETDMFDTIDRVTLEGVYELPSYLSAPAILQCVLRPRRPPPDEDSSIGCTSAGSGGEFVRSIIYSQIDPSMNDGNEDHEFLVFSGDPEKASPSAVMNPE